MNEAEARALVKRAMGTKGNAAAVIVGLMVRCGNLFEALKRFENVKALVSGLPATADRELVYGDLAFGEFLLDAVELADPEWMRDRDVAFRGVENAVELLRKVLAQRQLEHHLEGLDREFRDLEAGGPKASDLLRRGSDGGRGELMPTDGGRPLAKWRKETIKRLREHKVSKADARALVSAAGLSDPDPDPQKKRRGLART